MRSKKTFPYIVLILFVAMLLALPTGLMHPFKRLAVSVCSPLWAWSDGSNKESSVLHQENRVLREQLDSLKKQFVHESWVEKQIARLREIRSREVTEPFWQQFFERRAKELAHNLEKQLIGVSAKVIYRDPSFWNSYLWIDVGTKTNEKMGYTVVAKNSPVVVKNCLVGVVEDVEVNRSRIRLITDLQLVPAVQAIRGEQNNRRFIDLAEQILRIVESKEGIFESPEQEQRTVAALKKAKILAMQSSGDHYLAKGELFGSGSSLWRKKGTVLRGSGFNYDFADEEGPARDLRSAESLEAKEKQSLSLLLPGDLLVTNGFDGVFPAGLEVAVVTSIGILREGASSYDLEAVPLVANLDDLADVWVLPPE